MAISSDTGIPRGFAFIDMACSISAERAQYAHNGRMFMGHKIRVSFGMPCRHGASILQNNKPKVFPYAVSHLHA